MATFLTRIFGNGENRPPQVRRGPSGPRVATDARNKLIIADLQAGMTVDTLAAKYNLSRPNIYTITRDIPRPSRSKICDRDQQIAIDYANGETATSIGNRLGLTRERVCQVLRRTNAIEHRAERRRLAQEEIEGEAAEIKERARQEFQVKLDQGIELVRGGMSINEAAHRLDIRLSKVALLAAACKERGVQSKHGRWRDMEPKKARARELRSQGLSWDKISEICVAEGFGMVYAAWVLRYLPDLATFHRLRGATDTSTSTTPKALKQLKPPKPSAAQIIENFWTPERVEILIGRWMNGCSAAQCADIFGPPCTRNAVIGKINRLRASGELKQSNQPDNQQSTS